MCVCEESRVNAEPNTIMLLILFATFGWCLLINNSINIKYSQNVTIIILNIIYYDVVHCETQTNTFVYSFRDIFYNKYTIFTCIESLN